MIGSATPLTLPHRRPPVRSPWGRVAAPGRGTRLWGRIEGVAWVRGAPGAVAPGSSPNVAFSSRRLGWGKGLGEVDGDAPSYGVPKGTSLATSSFPMQNSGSAPYRPGRLLRCPRCARLRQAVPLARGGYRWSDDRPETPGGPAAPSRLGRAPRAGSLRACCSPTVTSGPRSTPAGSALDPFDPGMVQPSSVDVRLDRFFRVFENHRYPHIDPAEDQPDLTRGWSSRTATSRSSCTPASSCSASTYEVVTLPDDIAGAAGGQVARWAGSGC